MSGNLPARHSPPQDQAALVIHAVAPMSPHKTTLCVCLGHVIMKFCHRVLFGVV
jgi:hypothetical protein